MRENIIDELQCPACQIGRFEWWNIKVDNNDIEEGVLTCKNCQKTYPIINHVPRFVKADNYAASFGLEWDKHSITQMDKYNHTHISKDRFYSQTNWGKNLKNQKILEVGCGSGRFTQIALETGADVYSFDLSTAVDNCLANNSSDNLNIFQASIYELPFQKEYFDKIFCFGVLQHTPDVKKAFSNLVPYLKPGGEIVVDVYKKSLRNSFQSKYFLRILTIHIDSLKLYMFLRKIVPVLFPISCFLKSVPIFGNFLSSLIPIVNYKNVLPVKNEDLVDWAILDTFDMLSPKYDSPQTENTMKRWFKEIGLTDIHMSSQGMIVGKGSKPKVG